MEYHPWCDWNSNLVRNPGWRQYLVGSLTGAVASQKVTEAYKGSLSAVRNRAKSTRVYGSLTVRPTSRADAKAGPSDPAIPSGRVAD